MPIYEFRCQKCKTDFEELMFNTAEKIPCPKCGSKKVSKKLSIFGFRSGSNYVGTSGPSSGCSGCSSSNCSTCR